ncbi:uncharacterized protein CBL_07765 [Carabus blaptoides fortunei]
MKRNFSSIFTISSGKHSQEVENNRDPYEPADFETAIAAAKFGKFNLLMLVVALAASFSSTFTTTSMSYVLPAAQCDLELSLVDKGMLNACTYLGMISSSFFWGFLADTLGRKKLQVWGYWLDVFCNIGCALSQSFWMLLVFKYFSGFLVTGPYNILMSYLSEFHCTRYRSRVLVLTGMFLSTANVVLPMLAWWIIPMDITYSFFSGALPICALPSLLAAIGHTTLPESPKFLMSTGRNQEALQVFRKVYQMNTGNTKEAYPIAVLVEETTNVDVKLPNGALPEKKTGLQLFCAELRHLKELFFKPYRMNFILVNVIQFAGLMGVNTLRLWLPQLFTTIDEYNQAHNYTAGASLCDMLAYKPLKSNLSLAAAFEECTVTQVDNEVYINSIIVAGWSVVGFFFVGTLINAMGKKNLQIVAFTLSGICGIANYWSQNSLTMLAFSSAFITLVGICNQVLIGVIVELFPTSLRTIVVSLSLMSGRLGNIIGNMLFPILLDVGCLPPFIFVGGVTFACAILSLFLPSKVADFK